MPLDEASHRPMRRIAALPPELSRRAEGAQRAADRASRCCRRQRARRSLLLSYPLAFIVQMSFTEERLVPVAGTARCTRSTTTCAMAGRYLPNLLVTHPAGGPGHAGRPRLRVPVRLHPRAQGPLPEPRAGADGVPDVRRAVHRVRDAVHPAARRPASARSSRLSGIPGTQALYSLPSVVFAMSIFTFPFMVMNIGTALSQRRPDPGGGGRVPGRPADGRRSAGCSCP